MNIAAPARTQSFETENQVCAALPYKFDLAMAASLINNARPPYSVGTSSCRSTSGFHALDSYPLRSPLVTADFLSFSAEIFSAYASSMA